MLAGLTNDTFFRNTFMCMFIHNKYCTCQCSPYYPMLTLFLIGTNVQGKFIIKEVNVTFLEVLGARNVHGIME